MTFEQQLEQDFRQAEQELSREVRKIVLDAFSRIVTRTPVDNGIARGSWMVTSGAEESEPPGTEDPTGAAALNRVSEFVADYGVAGDLPAVKIYSNLPYIVALEEGWSAQAPSGMVALTITELT